MSENENEKQPAEVAENKETNKKDKVKTVTNYLLLFIVVMLGFSIVSDRIIPVTDNARVKGYIVPIKPQVSGNVLNINVRPNQLVEEGDELAVLDKSDYEIAVKQAEENLEIAGQNVGAQTASIASAQARLTSAIVERQNTEAQANRVLAMAEKGVVSKSDADKARASLATARANVVNAEADLEKAKQQLGAEGEEKQPSQSSIAGT